jgi:hypothetical protein
MAAPLHELQARVKDLDSDVTFVALATQLRPRVANVIDWASAGEELELVRRFMNEASTRPEGVYGPLLVRLLATFERFLRMLVVEIVEGRISAASGYDGLPVELKEQNVILTGRALATLASPRDYMTLDIQALIKNLATCVPGSVSFRLNAEAFAATITGASPDVMEKALRYVGIKFSWDDVGRSSDLTVLLGTRGTRETAKRARERLKELWKWRNHLAHAGDEETAVSESQLRDAMAFISLFSAVLDGTVQR